MRATNCSVECAPMFRRWAETRLYRKTMHVAVAQLRRAARTPNVLEKLAALDLAEQKLRDARWLTRDEDGQRLDGHLSDACRAISDVQPRT